MSEKTKLIAATAVALLTTAIAVLGISSRAFAQSSNSCFDQIAYLQQLVPINTAPQTVDGLTFYADLTRAEALNAEGYEDNCLMAVHRAAQDLAALKG